MSLRISVPVGFSVAVLTALACGGESGDDPNPFTAGKPATTVSSATPDGGSAPDASSNKGVTTSSSSSASSSGAASSASSASSSGTASSSSGGNTSSSSSSSSSSASSSGTGGTGAPTPDEGKTCTRDSDCLGHACIFQVSWRVCASTCRTTADCPRDHYCIDSERGLRICAH